MSFVSRSSERTQDTTMLAFVLFALPRQTGRVRKETSTNDDQVPCLSDSLSNPGRRHVLRFAHVISSQSISGYSSSKRWQYKGSKMRQLRRKQGHYLLLFCLSELSVCNLPCGASAIEEHKRSPQCFNREIASTRRRRIDPPTGPV